MNPNHGILIKSQFYRSDLCYPNVIEWRKMNGIIFTYTQEKSLKKNVSSMVASLNPFKTE